MSHEGHKVVWYEGMMLDPHHFQQWDRYHHDTLNTRVRALSRHDWGLARCAIDTERLANGELALLECEGVMPDGLVFRLPKTGRLPAARSLQEHFPVAQERLDVFLAIPSAGAAHSVVQRSQGGNGASPHKNTRYVAESIPLVDENTGTDERLIEVAHLNAQLRFAGESMEGYTALRVASVRRSAGHFVLDETDIPPSLSIAASERLTAIARRILELLVTKGRALAERHRGARNQREFAPGDVISLGMLSVINSHLPLVNHHLGGGSNHPESLFRTLLSLAGGLSAYTPSVDVAADLPSYDHASPAAGFNRLSTMLEQMLQEARASANYEKIDLTRTRDNLYTAEVAPALLQRAQLLLAARSDVRSEERIVQEFPTMVRVASPRNIDGVLRTAIPALRVEATRRLPPGMPIDERASYFRFLKQGPFWETILEEGAVAVFIPQEFADITLELIAVN